ncbi:MAG TPA: HAD-IA family hydrolase [Candidatus Baltobacteraceae bacterium]|nr:HAD-IA family hydrolase [Candidatus Baltobacteraceae bacterium]
MGLLNKYDAFIFDWDGTLNGMRFALRLNESVKHAFKMWNKDSAMKDFGKMNIDLRKKRLSGEVRKNSILVPLAEIPFYMSRPRLQSGTVGLLKRLKKADKYMAIVSNGNEHRLMRELELLGISDYFDIISSAKSLKAMKPNPSGIMAVVKTLGVGSRRSVYIGDMVDDVISAKLAHVASCAIADGFDSYHRLKGMKPDYIFKTIEAFEKAL